MWYLIAALNGTVYDDKTYARLIFQEYVDLVHFAQMFIPYEKYLNGNFYFLFIINQWK